MRQLDPGLPVRNLRSMDELVSRSIAPQRFNLSLLCLFSGLGLLLAAIGIYGVMAYSVSQRTHEIGLTRLMKSLLFGVSATDPLILAGVSLLVTIIALLACYLPARRAAKVDPLVALRYE